MSLTVAVQVPPSDRAELESWLRAPSIRAGLALRARIVLLAADGVGTAEIVRRVGVEQADGDRLEAALYERGDRRAGRPAQGRQAAHDRRRGDRAAHAGAATGPAGGDALVEPAASP